MKANYSRKAKDKCIYCGADTSDLEFKALILETGKQEDVCLECLKRETTEGGK